VTTIFFLVNANFTTPIQHGHNTPMCGGVVPMLWGFSAVISPLFSSIFYENTIGQGMCTTDLTTDLCCPFDFKEPKP